MAALREAVPFSVARDNFYACARHGLRAQVLWENEHSCNVASLLRARSEGGAGAFNLKVSKVGGLTKAKLMRDLGQELGLQVTIDLQAQTVSIGDQKIADFEIDEFRKYCLLNGLDDIGLTLQHADDIRAYEARRKQEAPWLFT